MSRNPSDPWPSNELRGFMDEMGWECEETTAQVPTPWCDLLTRQQEIADLSLELQQLRDTDGTFDFLSTQGAQVEAMQRLNRVISLSLEYQETIQEKLQQTKLGSIDIEFQLQPIFVGVLNLILNFQPVAQLHPSYLPDLQRAVECVEKATVSLQQWHRLSQTKRDAMLSVVQASNVAI